MRIILNGKEINIDNPKGSLLEYLRGTACLNGTKNGCNKAQCGACTVIVDGKAKRSCVIKLEKCGNANIETIEGLEKNGQLHPLQEAFMRVGAIQCGFCTPGMVMASKALLDSNPMPTDDQIKEALKFNICRCTGYVSIIEAVQLAAAVIRGEKSFPEDENGMIGTSVVRNDVLDKALGKPIYTDDLNFKNQLYGQVVYTKYPYTKILKVNISEAEKAPGVVKIITEKDIKGRKTFGLMGGYQTIMVGEGQYTYYIGDNLACVFAETKEQAINAANMVEIEYEILNGIFDAMTAAKEDTEGFHFKGKILGHTKVRRGDVNKAFAEADVIIEDDYYVPFVEHAYMEPESVLTKYNGNMLEVYTASQGSYEFKHDIANALNQKSEKVQVIGMQAGGGFGGKEECTVHIHAAIGTFLTKRPVKITMTREESMKVSTKRHAENLHYKMAAKKDGTITAIESVAIVDTGAYDSSGIPVTFRSGVVAAGPYSIENAHTDSISYYTNNPPGGAFRGFGSTQACVAAEIHIDRLAEALSIDPYTIREINALEPGKQTITGQTLDNDCGYKETLLAVKERMLDLKKIYEPSDSNKRIGFGIASTYKNVGIGIGLNDSAAAVVELTNKGEFRILHGEFEIGQGCNTIMAQIATETTGIPYKFWKVLMNDTRICPDGGETTASRQTFITGNAVRFASREFIRRLNVVIKNAYGLDEKNIKFSIDGVKDVLTSLMISWKDLYKTANNYGINLKVKYKYDPPKTYKYKESHTPKLGEDPKEYNIHIAYCFATHGLVLEVDIETGIYKVLHVVAAHDAGRVTNPLAFKGQVEGGVVMGIGYGMSEEYILKDGIPITTDLAKCKLPKITETPIIEVITIEKNTIEGPYGAKGMGELPINPPAPAISNALYNAIGVRITSFPITKEKVAAALSSIKKL